MAIYHCVAKAVARSAGRSATSSAAYRAGERIKDERTGIDHDYRKKQGVIHTEIVTPDGSTMSRERLWNMAEAAEKRKDGTPAKEYEVALPSEVTPEERTRLALELARTISKQEKCVVDVSIHEPARRGDERNYHAHLLCTTRELTPTGELGAKCIIEKSDGERKKIGLGGRREGLLKIRAAWAGIVNDSLERFGIADRVDHRSLAEQGIEREPTRHKGVAAVNMERRGLLAERTAQARDSAEVQAEIKSVSAELAALKREAREQEMLEARAEGHSKIAEMRKARGSAKAQGEIKPVSTELAAEKCKEKEKTMADEGVRGRGKIAEMRKEREEKKRRKEEEEQREREQIQMAREAAAKERRRGKGLER